MKKLLLLLPLAFGGFTAAATAAPAPLLATETAEETGRALGLLRLLSDEGPALARIRLDGDEGTFGVVHLYMNAEGMIRGRARTEYGFSPVRGSWKMDDNGLGAMNLSIVNSQVGILLEADFTMNGIVGEWVVVPRNRADRLR